MNRSGIIRHAYQGVILFVMLWAWLLQGCGQDVAGGGTEDGNTPIAGVIKDIKGPSGGVVVTLYPEGFNPVSDAVPDSLRDITDDDGRYLFKVSETGTYNVQAIHPENRTVSLVQGVVVTEADENKTVAVADSKLREPGAITIHLKELAVVEHGYLFIPGTGIQVPVSPADLQTGYVTIPNVPSAAYPAVHYAAPDDLTGSPLLEDEIDVQSEGAAVIGPYHAWAHKSKIIINTTVTGADIAEDVYNFPLLVRLDSTILAPPWGDGGGRDVRFAKSDGVTPLPYQIESWDALSQQAAVWVKVDVIHGNDDTQFIYLYTGNADAHPQSSGVDVFGPAYGYAGVWHLADDPSEGIDAVKDAAGGGNHGTAQGGIGSAGLVDGVIGGALDFDGVDDYLRVPERSELDGFSQVTISAWCRTNRDLPGNDTGRIWMAPLVVKHGEMRTVSYNFGWQGWSDGITFDLWDSSNVKHENDSWHDSLTADTWYFYAATYDGHRSVLYKDGVLLKDTLWGSFIMDNNDYPVEIGYISDKWQSHADSTVFHEGAIDEVRISSTARSAAWIKLSYENQKEGSSVTRIE